MERKSGVLMPISSLYGEYSCGSFGKEAMYFIDFLYECRFSYWQVLPFCMADECNSPYKSFSSFSGNLNFVDLEELKNEGLLTDKELDSVKQHSPYLCEYERLRTERFSLLKKASARVKDKNEIKNFVLNNKNLDAFCTFMAKREANGGKLWNVWTESEYDKEILFAWQFIQYKFFTQWQKIKEYANSKGIKIIGDIPIYVSLDSSDVWANKEQFLLDKKGNPTHVAGVSPDYFSEEGQLWGNPLYDWKEMKNDGYSWWRERIVHMASLFDAVRIDHFRGFESFWKIDAKSNSAKCGKWVKGPGYPFVKAITEAAGNTQIIAEDLGDITKEVYELVKKSTFPGMRVFQFGFLSDDDSTHLPHNYTENCIAYTGTHDNNTLLGFLWELDEQTRNRMLSYCGHEGPWQTGCESIIRTILASHASLVILPIQDILGFGSDTRINTPGKAFGNWEFRITREQLDSVDRGKYAYLNTLYFRQNTYEEK